jgi:hypothetical protein
MVEPNETAEGGQASKELRIAGHFPGQLDVAGSGGPEDEIQRSVTGHLVGDVPAVRRPGVVSLGKLVYRPQFALAENASARRGSLPMARITMGPLGWRRPAWVGVTGWSGQPTGQRGRLMTTDVQIDLRRSIWCRG